MSKSLLMLVLILLSINAFAQKETPTLTSSNIEGVRAYLSNSCILQRETFDTYAFTQLFL